MLLPTSSLLPTAEVIANKPSETDPMFPNNPQSPFALVVVIPKRISVCLAQLVAPKGDAPTIGTACAPKQETRGWLGNVEGPKRRHFTSPTVAM